ncbi:hypothetical protein CAPTEDRAFT_105875 [Capitella teleta]|uniref:C2H2-type domain-containing protein n=1 Tax=Capitella teleta TaxID=283909 RepID=R7UDA9_CAPTE|nr:hypothetical protein CAPTEDRAFT_105875 [Capitella teleta]|eukprot:ELU04370.1 hypothetical protein CAPTEDRAFT_105875 [Capitella teleta]
MVAGNVFCPWQGCGKRFTGVWHLRRHYRVHTGEKPYKCPACDFASAQRCHLNSHVAAHHPELHSAR